MTIVRTTLTPEGARLLRAARDQILAHPKAFNMHSWDCGTTACIAGHILRIAAVDWRSGDGLDVPRIINRLLGFNGGLLPLPLQRLFFKWDLRYDDVADAVNAVLWHYGYPPSEVADASATPRNAVDPCEGSDLRLPTRV